MCDADVMRQLLSRHPLLNTTDENGQTPLHIAIESRHITCVRLLLEAGADVKMPDARGRTAIDAALVAPPYLHDGKAVEEWRAIAALVWKAGRPRLRGPAGPMPWSLDYTVAHNQTDVTRMLLAMGVDPNAAGAGGTTALADAALKGDADSVRLLLEHGARPNAIGPAGTQPIHDAALGNSAKVIRELVAHGADINAQTRDDAQTPLHVAAVMGKMQALEALVALGADPNIKDSQGRTPLAAAERAGLTDVVAFLKRVTPVK